MTTTAMVAPEATRRPGFAHAVLAPGGFAIRTTELDVDAPTSGYVVSAYAPGVVVDAPLLAVVGARLNRRLFLILLLTWFGLGNCFGATASSFDALVALPHGAIVLSACSCLLISADPRRYHAYRIGARSEGRANGPLADT